MSKSVCKMAAAFGGLCLSATYVASAEPTAGAAIEVPIQQSGPPQSLVFRYCPAGKLRPGKPNVLRKDAELTAGLPSQGTSEFSQAGDDTTEIRAFYISEAEITIPQFKQVVSRDTFMGLQTRVEKLTGKPELVAAVKSAKDLPVFAVTVEDAATFCKSLTERLKADGASASLEARRCRLPSHREWQYACRARTDPHALPPLPHFNRWPESFEVLDKAARATCLDEWRELGKAEAEFQGTQEQIAAILERQTPTNNKPLELLSAFLKAGLGVQRNYAENRPGELLPGRSAPANAWQIYDMHESLREWVIAANDPADLYQFWERITSSKTIDTEVRQKKAFFLAGGGFNNLMTGKTGAWQEFTIWGGYPLDLASGSPLPFSMDEAISKDVAFDEDPGLRVVLERVLREDWLLAVRRLAVYMDAGQLRQQHPFDGYRAQIADLVPSNLQPRILAQLAFYESLATYRDGRKNAARQQFGEAKKHLLPNNKSAKLANLADLVGGSSSTPSTVPEKIGEDMVFLNHLEYLLSADTEVR